TDSQLCSFSLALLLASSTPSSVAPAPSRREAVPRETLRFVLITTKSSTRPLTCNTNRGKPVLGSDLIGGMTVGWWRVLCRSPMADRLTWPRLGLRPTRNFRLACSAAAYTRPRLHLCPRHARRGSLVPLSSVFQPPEPRATIT